MNTRCRPTPQRAPVASAADSNLVLKTLSLSLLLAFGPSLHALPTAGVVTAGSATITSTGANSLVINQTSQNAALNWRSFQVGAGESIVFVQPNSNSVALNRVLGADPSRVLGSLSANGKVFLINPNGILFGKNASVNVGGLVASTLDITDGDFLAGHYRFDGPGTGTVDNQGTIRATEGGYVALLGNRVSNEGTISAKLGSVALGAGRAATLEVSPDGLLHVAIDQAALNALASNGGSIQADGGAVLMSAQARDALLSTVVNNTGLVQANSVGQHNGRIVLEGGDAGVVSIGGVLRAAGTAASTTGGTIVATGDKVAIGDGARLEANGVAGGGAILVGGGWQGSDPGIRQARGVYVSPSATLEASAIQEGNGGTVVAWSNTADAQSTTRVYGSLVARGGVEGGDGGRIETSGHWIDVSGLRADAGAPRGKPGQWLLDPADLVVGAAPTDATFAPGSPATFTSGAATPNVLSTDIEAQLNAGTSVVLQTGAVGPGTGSITVGANIAKTGGGGASLTLNAAGNIGLSPGVTISSSSGALQINLTSGGTISFAPGSNLFGNGGNITMTASAVNGIPPLVGTGSETLTLNIQGSTSIGLGSGAGAMLLPMGFAAGFSTITIQAGSGNVTIGGPVGFVNSVSIATSGSIIIDPASAIATSNVGGILALAGSSFVNNSGPTAVSTLGGGGARWVIYSSDPSANTFGGLSSGNQAIWGQTFSSLPPGSAASGNRYVFATPGAVTATTSGTFTKSYGQVASLAADVTYSGVPLSSAATYGNVYQDLLITDVLSVLPTVTSAGAAAGATVAGGPYAVYATGGVANPGYSISYVNGAWLVVNKATLDIAALADSRIYNGQPYTGGNGVVFSGFVNGDSASVLGGSLVYGGSSQGAVNAGQYVIVPSGLTSNDYTIRFVSAPLNIRPREVTVTGLIADNKEFDGTAFATIRSWGTVNTGVGLETLVLNHGGARFSDSEIGKGKVVTVDGYSLADGNQGGVASNYVLASPIAKTTADIVAPSRSQTLRAVQSTISTMAGPTRAEGGGATLNLDASAMGLSASDLERRLARGGDGDRTVTSPATAPALTGNRTPSANGGSTARTTGGQGGLLAAGATQSASTALPAANSGASMGTSRFRSSGLSSVPKVSAGAPAPRAVPVPRDAFLKGAARTTVVGATSSGAAVLAALVSAGPTSRLVVTVAPGEGFGIAIPRDLFDKAGSSKGPTSAAPPSVGAALPSWVSFDRSGMRLSATQVPPGALPITLTLPGANGKSVEVLLK